ncbi:hypothetical protein BGP_6583 [Beggiatoa sp. PS]|nr:hypothetical protein BGP_6583 [Beggiatoa sp. PS]
MAKANQNSRLLSIADYFKGLTGNWNITGQPTFLGQFGRPNNDWLRLPFYHQL